MSGGDDPTVLGPNAPKVDGSADTVILEDAHSAATVAFLDDDLSADTTGDSPERGYTDLGLIATGGMGEVRKVEDGRLNRVVVMKIIRESHQGHPGFYRLFLHEAQVTAQLTHPGIPPVHEIGRTDDGRPFFTMKEVRGQTLSQIIKEARKKGGDWTLWRRLEVFHKVCEAMAYAHTRGVLHCDLKPANIMVGEFGEVVVMDWGLARIASSHIGENAPRLRDDFDESSMRTGPAGTPAYMAPEQIVGESSEITPASDVYALGVTLYELLSGQRPFQGSSFHVIMQARTGRVAPLETSVEGDAIDPALQEITAKAMSRLPDGRYPDAAALGAKIGAWLEGSLRRERAAELLEEARSILPGIAPRRDRARRLRELAEGRLRALEARTTLGVKAGAWLLLDEAQGLEQEAELALVRMTQLLQGSLVHDEIPEAHSLLADVHYERHAQAERRRSFGEAARHEVLLRAHDQGNYADYLAGRGALSLETDPPCKATLFRYGERARRMVPLRERELGKGPFLDVELPVGSWALLLEAGDRPPVWYPFLISRLYGWIAQRPGDTTPTALRLPAQGEVGDNEVFVPAGWFVCGGDPDAPGAGPATRLWVDSFAMRRHPVTQPEYLAFLQSDAGAAWLGDYLRDHPTLWRPRWPAVGMAWPAAQAFAGSASARLPSELEWEKAARGVDGRYFPWGDHGDHSFCHYHADDPLPATVDLYEGDLSVYEVQGMGGNVREWCADGWRAEGVRAGTTSVHDEEWTRLRVTRGGSFRRSQADTRAAARHSADGTRGHDDVGIRLVRTL